MSFSAFTLSWCIHHLPVIFACHSSCLTLSSCGSVCCNLNNNMLQTVLYLQTAQIIHIQFMTYFGLWPVQAFSDTTPWTTKNVPPYFCPYLRQLLTDFQNSFTGTLCRQFAIMRLLYIPPHSKCVSTLPYFVKYKCAKK